jgi:hypothetical protein
MTKDEWVRSDSRPWIDCKGLADIVEATFPSIGIIVVCLTIAVVPVSIAWYFGQELKHEQAMAEAGYIQKRAGENDSRLIWVKPEPSSSSSAR